MKRVQLGLVGLAMFSCSDQTPSPKPFEPETSVNDGGSEKFPDTSFGTSDASRNADGKPSAPNLIGNGDFEQGNVAFLSDYVFADNNTSEGQYTVGTNAQLFNINLVNGGDHTSGTGKMFIGNGKATPDRAWRTETSVAVTPNTNYFFEIWVMNLCCKVGSPFGDGVNAVAPAKLSFYANGQLLGTRDSNKLGTWEGLSTNWNSGSATSVELRLENANTEPLGNDFAADDIYLGIESQVNPR
jgi:hypothetical protein